MNQDPQNTQPAEPNDISHAPADKTLNFQEPVHRDTGLEEFALQIQTGKSIKKHMASIAASSKDLWMIPIGEFYVIPNFNPRVKNEAYEEGIRVLANSIVNEGFFTHKPISVALIEIEGKERLAVKDGHRRLEAAKLAISMGAELTSLPAIVSKDGESIDEMNWEVLKTAEGQQLSTYEKAIQVRRLLKSGFTQADISKRSGYSLTAIGNMIKLIEAPKQIQNLVEAGQISSSLVIETITQMGAAQATQVITATAAETPKDKKITKRSITKRASKPEKQVDSVMLSLAESMANILVSITEWEGYKTLPVRLQDNIQSVLQTKAQAEADQ